MTNERASERRGDAIKNDAEKIEREDRRKNGEGGERRMKTERREKIRSDG